MSARARVGVVGLGHWGPNLARSFAVLPHAEPAWVCDGSEERLARVAPRFPGARAGTSLEELLADAHASTI